jgi:hypothetical protein
VSPAGEGARHCSVRYGTILKFRALIHIRRRGPTRADDDLMANTSALSREERKKSKRAARKKRKAENPLKPREYARGSQKRKVKKMVRGQSKRA